MSGKNQFISGAIDAIPVTMTSAPFGLLFGVLAVDNGLSPLDAVLMSLFIYGGASQLVGLELFAAQVAPWLIVLSIAAVNFRHVLYSAALGRRLGHWRPWQRAIGFFFLTDPQFAQSEREIEQGRKLSFTWYAGFAACMFAGWMGGSWAGVTFGKLIPDTQALGFDFMLPIYFFSLVMGFRRRSFWLPVVVTSAVASILAYHTIGSPWHVTVGAAAGVALAAMLPLRQPQPAMEPAE
jgi:predicted branched-subunit amino acid permease